jgi:hypothetical protein
MRETEVPYGAFAMWIDGNCDVVFSIQFEIDGDVEVRMGTLARSCEL